MTTAQFHGDFVSAVFCLRDCQLNPAHRPNLPSTQPTKLFLFSVHLLIMPCYYGSNRNCANGSRCNSRNYAMFIFFFTLVRVQCVINIYYGRRRFRFSLPRFPYSPVLFYGTRRCSCGRRAFYTIRGEHTRIVQCTTAVRS